MSAEHNCGVFVGVAEGELAPVAGGRLNAITAGFVFVAGILTLAIVIAVHINGRARLGL